MAGANAHLMLIYNFHQIGENWLRIEWKLKFFFAWEAIDMGQATKVRLFCYLVLLSTDSKTC